MAKRRGSWPTRGFDRIQGCIGRWNAKPPRGGQIYIAWGDRDEEEAAEEGRTPADYRILSALLNYAGADYSLRASNGGVPSVPDRLSISSRLPEADTVLTLPTNDPRKLFNVVKCCSPGVTLNLVPDDLNDRANPTIAVVGVEVCLPLDSLTPRILRDSLAELWVSRQLVWDRLAEDKGDDHWRFYCDDLGE